MKEKHAKGQVAKSSALQKRFARNFWSGRTLFAEAPSMPQFFNGSSAGSFDLLNFVGRKAKIGATDDAIDLLCVSRADNCACDRRVS